MMRKLRKKANIPAINIPKTIKNIVDGLFPLTPVEADRGRDTRLYHVDKTQDSHEVNEHKKAPGPDGIPNPVLKTIVEIRAELLLNVFNKCLLQGVFSAV